jgi:hypothetical protein
MPSHHHHRPTTLPPSPPSPPPPPPPLPLPPPMPPSPRPHPFTLASAVTIAAASANVTAPPTLLLMVGCCVVCRSSPAASYAVQICLPPPSCGHDVDEDSYCHRRRLPSPLPQSTTTTGEYQRLSFVVDGGNDDHCRL